jgi:hypothetical protein
MNPRRSSRATTTPLRYGYDQPIPSVETIKEEVNPEGNFYDVSPEGNSGPGIEEAVIMDFTAAQQAHMEQAIQAAVTAAVSAALAAQAASPTPAGRTPTPVSDRQSRALTADLQPSEDYYLPKLDQSTPAVDASKVKYPRLAFSDHKGDVEYDAWKMDMKLFIEEYSGNFKTGSAQVKAYFRCTAGEAKTIILQHMDPDFAGTFDSAADVLKALDQRFFDHNRVQAARIKYNKLEMGNSMTYNEFRIKFTAYATAGKISPTRWFEDVCEKVSPALKRDIRIEKYKMDNNYTVLDEFLAIADRESRNIHAEELSNVRKPAVTFNNDPRGILKKESWRPATPAAIAPSIHARPLSPAPNLRRPASPSASAADDATCYHCHGLGHYVKDCPERRKQQQMEKKIAEIVIGEEIETDKLSENC